MADFKLYAERVPNKTDDVKTSQDTAMRLKFPFIPGAIIPAESYRLKIKKLTSSVKNWKGNYSNVLVGAFSGQENTVTGIIEGTIYFDKNAKSDSDISGMKIDYEVESFELDITNDKKGAKDYQQMATDIYNANGFTKDKNAVYGTLSKLTSADDWDQLWDAYYKAYNKEDLFGVLDHIFWWDDDEWFEIMKYIYDLKHANQQNLEQSDHETTVMADKPFTRTPPGSKIEPNTKVTYTLPRKIHALLRSPGKIENFLLYNDFVTDKEGQYELLSWGGLSARASDSKKTDAPHRKTTLLYDTFKVTKSANEKLPLAQRIIDINKIFEDLYVTEGSENEILSLISNMPRDQYEGFYTKLTENNFALFNSLHSRITGSNRVRLYSLLDTIMALHGNQATSQKYLDRNKQLSTNYGALQGNKDYDRSRYGEDLLPFASPGLFRQFSRETVHYNVETLSNGRIRVTVNAERAKGKWAELLASTMVPFAPVFESLFGDTLGPFEYDPDKQVAIHILSGKGEVGGTGQVIIIPAIKLKLLAQVQNNNDLNKVIEIAAIALAVITTAATMGGAGPEWVAFFGAAGSALSVGDALIDDFQEEILQSNYGKEFLSAWRYLNLLFLIVSVPSLLRGAWSLLRAAWTTLQKAWGMLSKFILNTYGLAEGKILFVTRQFENLMARMGNSFVEMQKKMSLKDLEPDLTDKDLSGMGSKGNGKGVRENSTIQEKPITEEKKVTNTDKKVTVDKNKESETSSKDQQNKKNKEQQNKKDKQGQKDSVKIVIQHKPPLELSFDDGVLKGTLDGKKYTIYRSGSDFTLKPREYRVTPGSPRGPATGPSLDLNWKSAEELPYGGAHYISSLPDDLQIIHTPGKNPWHCDIIPKDLTLSQEQFQEILNKIEVKRASKPIE